MPLRLVIINGAVRGSGGNTARALVVAEDHARAVGPDVISSVVRVDLAEFAGDVSALVDTVRSADLLLFGSGVYWSSWGSPLQRFLEVMTPYEATDVFVGKSVGAVLTMDSVGGTDVAARLLFALSLFGCTSPPFAAVVLSRIAERSADDDVWQPADLHTLVDNLVLQASTRPAYKRWPVVAADAVDGPWPLPGPLDLGLPDFGRSATGK